MIKSGDSRSKTIICEGAWGLPRRGTDRGQRKWCGLWGKYTEETELTVKLNQKLTPNQTLKPTFVKGP